MPNDDGPATPFPIGGLTRRERECLALAADGYRQKEIGLRLKISARTVETHLKHVRERLGVADARDAARAWTAYQNASSLRANPGSGLDRLAEDPGLNPSFLDDQYVTAQTDRFPAAHDLGTSSGRAELHCDSGIQTRPSASNHTGIARGLGTWAVRPHLGHAHSDAGRRGISPRSKRTIANALTHPFILLGGALAIAAMCLAIIDGGVNVLNRFDVFCRQTKTCEWATWARPSVFLRLKR